MKLASYHEGDRSEPLAQTILSAIAHIVPVPRPADYFGVDLFAHLFDQTDGSLNSAGRTVAIQVKSNYDSISVVSPDAIYALHTLAVPFFIGVVNRQRRTLELYSTLFRFTGYWSNPDAHLVFDLKTDTPSLTFGDNVIRIGCGPPIAIASQDDLDHPDRDRRAKERHALRHTLDYWIRLEMDAIAWKVTGLPVSPCPPAEWETGEYPGAIVSCSISTSNARLGPLLHAMQHSAHAFYMLCEAALERENIPSAISAEMAQYAGDHMRRINEFREKLSAQLGPGGPYFTE